VNGGRLKSLVTGIRVALLEVSQDVVDGGVVVSVGGEIDTSNFATLVSHLGAALKVAADHPSQVLVIELGEVTYFGSAGLNAVLTCYEQGLSQGVAVRVVARNAEVLRPIQITKLDSVLEPFDTLTAAIENAR
jgi:anti-anti-sigma factor